MAIFLTGSTGYIGAHVAANLLRDHGAALNVLVRARDVGEAERRLWQALQLHLEFPQFYEFLQTRVRVFRGDLTESGFGLERDEYDRLVHTTDSVIHCAASLNRKSEKSCLNAPWAMGPRQMRAFSLALMETSPFNFKRAIRPALAAWRSISLTIPTSSSSGWSIHSIRKMLHRISQASTKKGPRR